MVSSSSAHRTCSLRCGSYWPPLEKQAKVSLFEVVSHLTELVSEALILLRLSLKKQPKLQNVGPRQPLLYTCSACQLADHTRCLPREPAQPKLSGLTFN